MPEIIPVSDLRNYSKVLNRVSEEGPVYLTKNGRGRYVIIDIDEYEKLQAKVRLMSELSEAEKAVKNTSDWLDNNDVKKELGV